MDVFDAITAIGLHGFGRAGGGGSSGGGGSGGGGGGAGVLIVLLGYIPMHFIGAKLRNWGISRNSWPIFQGLAWGICAIYCLILLVFGFWGVVIGAFAIIGTGAGLYNWFSALKSNKNIAKKLQAAAQADSTWDETAIIQRVKEVFSLYQTDWSQRNWQAMARYMTPEYSQHSALMVAALVQAHRMNEIKEIVIEQAIIVDMVDSPDDNSDTVTVGISAHAKDTLFDDRDSEKLFEDDSSFTEYWHFRRQGDMWLLDGIQQATEEAWLKDSALQKFAEDNNYFYSLDWGWLLLPRRGNLFGSSKFGTSDINNHVIGIYNQYYLLQLYTYIPNPQGNHSYLIAQTNVPKTYGEIIVRRKKRLNLFSPKGLKRVSMEWGDFNKKYEVFAEREEQVTSFELLHPVFMEKLEALPFEVNIEVVDNVVYLYAPQNDKTASPNRYTEMLEILREAFKQMKL